MNIYSFSEYNKEFADALQVNPKNKFGSWLAQQIKKITDNYKNPISQDDLRNIEILQRWAYETNLDIQEMTFKEAVKEARQWIASQLNSKDNTVYRFDDSYKIVQLTDEDAENEKLLMQLPQNMHNKDSYTIFSLRNKNNLPVARILVPTMDQLHPHDMPISDILGAELSVDASGHASFALNSLDDRWRIKNWLNKMKNDGYEVRPLEMKNSDADKFNISHKISNLLGPSDNYDLIPNDRKIQDYKTALLNIEDQVMHSFDESFDAPIASRLLDTLLKHVDNFNDFEEFEAELTAYEHTAFQQAYNAVTDGRNPEIQNYPEKSNFYVYPDHMSKEVQPYFDKEAFDKAIREYDDILNEYEGNWPPVKLAEMAFKKLEQVKKQSAKNHAEVLQKRLNLPPLNNMLQKEKEKEILQSHFKKGTMMKKIAEKEEISNNPLSPDDLSAYVESLKLFDTSESSNKTISPELKKMIKRLPSANKIRKDFSNEECNILYETVAYIWKKVTGNELITDKKIYENPSKFLGSYWLLRNGIFLHGVNHKDIIKKNCNLVQSLLGINGFTMQEYISGDANKLIRFIILCGGIRMFVDSNNKSYYQLSEITYAKWGRKKIKKLPVNPKILKLIDPEASFDGWKSGIIIKI